MIRYAMLFLLLIAADSFSQPVPPLLDPKLRDLFHEKLSGESAKEHVVAITRHHRIQGSRGYRNAANYVLGKLREYGFSEKDGYIESFKSDGRVQYQTWQSPSGWDITSAELRMVEHLLNTRPRKRLGWKTPYRVFYELTGVALES